MKIRSLLLGSIAAAGLSTGAFAADLGVLTSLDVCDALGISGLTISSDTNCLQISGKVTYEFSWGDYKGNSSTAAGVITGGGSLVTINTPSGAADDVLVDGFDTTAGRGTAFNNDWRSKYEAYLKVVATADSDFGPAKAVIGLKSVERLEGINENSVVHPDTTSGVILNEAYVAVGDSTVLMAGKKKDGNDGTIGNFGDDTSFNFLNLFNEKKVDAGVLFADDASVLGGHSIQIVSDLGNGISVGAALENLEGTLTSLGGVPLLGTSAPEAGTLLGVVQYAGEGITAHATVGAIGVLDGNLDTWFIHTGATGTFDAFKLRAALGYLRSDLPAGITSNLDALASAQATFDLFTIALSGEFARNEAGSVVTQEGYGFGGSVGAQVTDGVAINLGARWFHNKDNTLAVANPLNEEDVLQIAAQIKAAVTETVTLTGEVGGYWNNSRTDANLGAGLGIDGTIYGAAEVAWAPGGGFTSSLKGEAYSTGGYKATFKAAKSFE